jgi:hypothetical protein
LLDAKPVKTLNRFKFVPKSAYLSPITEQNAIKFEKSFIEN